MNQVFASSSQNRAEEARKRYLNSQPSRRKILQNLKERLKPQDLSITFKRYWWVLAVLISLGGALIYFGSSHTLTPSTVSLDGNVRLEIPLVSIGLGLLFVFSLLETTARGDPLLLDFFAAWGLTAILVIGQIFGHESNGFWFALGGAFLTMFVGTFFNPGQETENEWWNRIDTTHWYVAGVALIFIYLMGSKTIPYPTYLPIVVPIIIATIAIGKEFFRQSVFSLVAFAVGIVPAITQNLTWISLGFAVTFFLAAIGAKQGWITARGTNHTISIGKLNLKFIMAWDLVLFYLIEVVLIGFAIHQNYVVFTIG